MAQDHLQIALEHHRAGRVRQAEVGYRDALAEDPANAEALHWLGVLLFQAGATEQAIGLLERAVALRPSDAAFHYNFGKACLRSGRADRAVEAFERSAELDPMHAETFLSLGYAYLARQSQGDAEAAIQVLRQANIAGLDSAELHHCLSSALLSAGRVEDAIASARATLERKPEDVQAHHQLAVASRAKGDLEQARASLERVIELEPNSVRACYALAVMEAEAGRLDKATTLFRRCVNLDAQFAPAYEGLSTVLQKVGKHEEAMRVLKRAARVERQEPKAAPKAATVAELDARLALSPEQDQLRFALAAYANVATAGGVPAASVSGLFDRYADRFDEHLRGALQYRAPELIYEAVLPLLPARKIDVLDLGCGTGLCGIHLRPHAASLAGVDLSQAMIAKAQARNLYDQLEVGDLVAALERHSRSLDLLLAADVLNYLGDLTPAFQAAAKALRPGGLFAFSTEVGAGDRYQLQGHNFRFRHSEPYLKRLASISGFVEESFNTVVLRTEGATPVSGYLMVLRVS